MWIFFFTKKVSENVNYVQVLLKWFHLTIDSEHVLTVKELIHVACLGLYGLCTHHLLRGGIPMFLRCTAYACFSLSRHNNDIRSLRQAYYRGCLEPTCTLYCNDIEDSGSQLAVGWGAVPFFSFIPSTPFSGLFKSNGV